MSEVSDKPQLYAEETPGNERMKERVRKSACSGSWFSSSSDELAGEIDLLLSASGGSEDANVKAVIVPHAGYAYSGRTAAKAFSLIPKTARKVIILGTAHHYPLVGASVDDADFYETPLGRVKLSGDAKKLLQEKNFSSVEEATVNEHSIEMELPFLQRLLRDFSIVPLIVGRVEPEAFAAAIEKYLDSETFLVVSADLSHFHSRETAWKLDSATIKRVLALDSAEILNCEVDSPWALSALLRLARRKCWTPRLLDYRTSGDATGDYGSVVGYCAVGFYEAYSATEKAYMLGLARKAVEAYVAKGGRISPEAVPERLLEKGGVFVTIKENGALRGCVGTLFYQGSICNCIIGSAISAAVHDTRFPPVTESELPLLEYSISILTQPKKAVYANSDELLRKIARKGVIVSEGQRSATYLPQVWEELHDGEQFMCSLCEKAGLPRDEWRNGSIDILTYEAIIIP